MHWFKGDTRNQKISSRENWAYSFPVSSWLPQEAQKKKELPSDGVLSADELRPLWTLKSSKFKVHSKFFSFAVTQVLKPLRDTNKLRLPRRLQVFTYWPVRWNVTIHDIIRLRYRRYSSRICIAVNCAIISNVKGSQSIVVFIWEMKPLSYVVVGTKKN